MGKKTCHLNTDRIEDGGSFPAMAKKPETPSLNLGVGVAIGVMIGMMLDNLAAGIGIGIALGIALSLKR